MSRKFPKARNMDYTESNGRRGVRIRKRSKKAVNITDSLFASKTPAGSPAIYLKDL